MREWWGHTLLWLLKVGFCNPPPICWLGYNYGPPSGPHPYRCHSLCQSWLASSSLHYPGAPSSPQCPQRHTASLHQGQQDFKLSCLYSMSSLLSAGTWL